jgi:hypothetical protein
MSRNAKLIATAVLAVITVAVLAVTYVQGQGLSPQDRSMKATAHRFAQALRSTNGRYSAIPDSLQAFNLFQHDQQTVLASKMKSLSGPGEFAEIQVWETKTMPPASLMLRSTKEPIVNVSGDLLSKAAAGDDVFANVGAGSAQYRVYLTALQPPPSIKALDAHEILLVIRPA